MKDGTPTSEDVVLERTRNKIDQLLNPPSEAYDLRVSWHRAIRAAGYRDVEILQGIITGDNQSFQKTEADFERAGCRGFNLS